MFGISVAPESDISETTRVVRRIASMYAEVARTHGLGHGPGHLEEPWTIDGQLSLVPVYRRSLPDSYLAKLSQSFMAAASTVDEVVPDTDERSLVSSYLRAVASALREELGTVEDDMLEHVGAMTPAAMRFDLIAGLVSKGAAQRVLHAADHTVGQLACQGRPVAFEERVWLEQIAAGRDLADVAVDSGMSERTLYRKLARLRDQFDASSTIELISITQGLGILDAPTSTGLGSTQNGAS